jgi:hypothetical protein
MHVQLERSLPHGVGESLRRHKLRAGRRRAFGPHDAALALATPPFGYLEAMLGLLGSGLEVLSV